MARPLRIEFTGACYHVINRGNDRRGLFIGARDNTDRVLNIDKQSLRCQS